MSFGSATQMSNQMLINHYPSLYIWATNGTRRTIKSELGHAWISSRSISYSSSSAAFASCNILWFGDNMNDPLYQSSGEYRLCDKAEGYARTARVTPFILLPKSSCTIQSTSDVTKLHLEY